MPAPSKSAFERAVNRDVESLSENPLIALAGALRGIPLLENAACKGLGPQFDYKIEGESPEQAERRRKASLAICRSCPALAPCAAQAKRAPHAGVVGGRVIRERSDEYIREKQYRAPCGTESGAKRHYLLDEKPCEPCRLALRAARKRRHDAADSGEATCSGCGKTYSNGRNLRRHRAAPETLPACRVVS